MLMMTSRILKSANFTRTQKSRYLENETLFFFQIKKFINHTLSVVTKNSFVAEVTFKFMFKEFFYSEQRSLFTIHDPIGIKLLSRL